MGASGTTLFCDPRDGSKQFGRQASGSYELSAPSSHFSSGSCVTLFPHVVQKEPYIAHTIDIGSMREHSSLKAAYSLTVSCEKAV
jgi:hypothetical protein